MSGKEAKVFEVGERVVIYSHGMRIIGEISSIDGVRYTIHTSDTCVGRFYCHEKQLRKLVKEKRRGWWIKFMYCGVFGCSNFQKLFTDGISDFIRTTKPDDTTGWIYVEEKRVK